MLVSGVLRTQPASRIYPVSNVQNNKPTGSITPGRTSRESKTLRRSGFLNRSGSSRKIDGFRATSDSIQNNSIQNSTYNKVNANRSDKSGSNLTDDIKLNSFLMKLQQRDTEVRQHEMAHKSVGGQYAGGISYSYQKGPDGRMYAIGGEVGIDSSPVKGDPEATLQKAEIVERAALAPAQPSGQDLKVAASARQMRLSAQMEINQGKTGKSKNQNIIEKYNWSMTGEGSPLANVFSIQV